MRMYNIILSIILFCAIIFLVSCSKSAPKLEVDETNIKNPELKLTNVMAINMVDNKESILEIEGNTLKKAESLSNVKDSCYNMNNKVVAYLNMLSTGSNLTKSYVNILNNKSSFNIKGSYAYTDLRLSKSGSKLALRSFSKDALTSAEGLSIYSTKSGKKLDFDKSVIVSGDLYRWKDDDNLIYYGVTNNGNNYGKIYSYDFKSNKSSVIFDKLQGYCTFLLPLSKGDLVYIESEQDRNTLKYYDANKNQITVISENLDAIYDYVIDNTGSEIYLIGKQSGIDAAALYKISIQDKKLVKITFDFPELADKTGGMAIDNGGKVYFCGTEVEYGAANIYMYDKNSNSTNLISTKSGVYHILSNSK